MVEDLRNLMRKVEYTVVRRRIDKRLYNPHSVSFIRLITHLRLEGDHGPAILHFWWVAAAVEVEVEVGNMNIGMDYIRDEQDLHVMVPFRH